MAHHSSNDSEEGRRLLREIFLREIFPRPLGATGRFPEGKLTPDDEGEIAVAIGSTPNGSVVMDFGKSVTWIGFTRAQAKDIAALLLKHAGEA